ncbi:hypothetical protein VTN49DRAFT_8031 [Thermomyces lanuginosus]|uniref:uncharacterized protein n=1 Tax=Thermomyces lanuginosus TaxID=5541 RepID=UPI0037434956
MSKRCHSLEPQPPPPKRHRADSGARDYISSLSDEILLHILSFLPTQTLLTCQRISRRFRELAGDSELWKRQYFSRWVLPRARHAQRIRQNTDSSGTGYSPKVSQWIGHGHLAEEGKVTHWKTQYKLRHNWAKGICRVRELEVAQPPPPPILACLSSGIVFTADKLRGLRAWATKQSEKELARVPFSTEGAIPTALTASQGPVSFVLEVAVGFDDGRLDYYQFNAVEAKFTLSFTHVPPDTASITAMALSPPYLLAISKHKVLSLFKLPADQPRRSPPMLIASLEAGNIFAPLSLSLRCSDTEVVAAIAYSFCHISSGWSMGIQELHFTRDGDHISSRLATTVDLQHSGKIIGSTRARLFFGPSDGQLASCTIHHKNPPTSVSYAHPYLLTSHSDNTLTMYLVVSSKDKLIFRSARRLWGHTSSVSRVQVSERGKAVSVSSRGDDIRVWELETLIGSTSHRLREENGIRIHPNSNNAGGSSPCESATISWSQLKTENLPSDNVYKRGWVGFDDEQVVVLRERGQGTQLLACYDFT